MNPLFQPTPAELRVLIHWHAERRDHAALLCDRAAYERHVARIAELERMPPERQYEEAA
ncbi:MAG: hypothetical protein ACTHMO_03870 [Rhodanobacteraceae bacterium]